MMIIMIIMITMITTITMIVIDVVMTVIISDTSRSREDGEIDHSDYHFVSRYVVVHCRTLIN